MRSHLMLWITWCLPLFSIHKFILPNYTSHSGTILTFSRRLFSVVFPSSSSPSSSATQKIIRPLLSLITTEGICLVQTNTEWAQTRNVGFSTTKTQPNETEGRQQKAKGSVYLKASKRHYVYLQLIWFCKWRVQFSTDKVRGPHCKGIQHVRTYQSSQGS